MAKSYPTSIYNFIVCESARQEIGGKASLLGVYTLGVILLPEDALFPAIIPLALYTVFRDGEGTFDPTIELLDPKGDQIISATMGSTPKQAKEGMQLVLSIPALPLISVGTYKVRIHLDKRLYEETFSIGTAPRSRFPQT